MDDKKSTGDSCFGDGGEGMLEANPAIRDAWSGERFMRLVMDPTGRPMYPKQDALHFVAEVNPDTVREWLPDNLNPVDPALATVYIADLPRTAFSVAYQEAGLFLHCVFEDQEHMFCAWMVLNDDTPMIMGRELSGLPKKIAEVEVSMNAEDPRGEVRRRGYTVLEISGSNPSPLEDGELFQLPILNVRGAPGLGDGELLRGCANHRLHEGQAMDLKVSVGKSEFDPLYRLELPGEVRGERLVIDVGLSDVMPRINLTNGVVGSVSADWVTRAYPFRCY